jgi:hypothetical protein
MGTEPPDRPRPVLSHCISRRVLGLPFRGVLSPRGRQYASVLTARIPGGPDLLRGIPPLSVHLYQGELIRCQMIMAIMRVPIDELLCHTVMEWIPVVEYLLSGARGRLRLHLVLLSIKWHRYPRIPALWSLGQYLGYP